ncbi:hypothetical protein SAMN04488109_5379 [Chryseolinea serpens]|uniref:Uncharacterized protein n=1 Tax=Chryseolinea serpens TaxID=947013 RepID=A0A1M5VSX8_9BACT|nr:hypothetical protein SAMN04488109_5379 [Chryseolinea serpens]
MLSAVGGIGFISISAAYYYMSDAGDDDALTQPQSLSLIWDTKAIRHIGNQYRLIVPVENSAHALSNLLRAESFNAGASIVSRLNESITHDFETGNTVLVDGWILSVTEARQCALASTLQPD